MGHWVFEIVDRLGAAGVGLLILLENLVPPVPSEVILPLTGFRARTGALDILWVWPVATAGSVAGALVLYGLGAWLGYDRLHAMAGRPLFVITGQKDLERGRHLFAEQGGKMVLIGRCVPFVRSVISIPAGVCGMRSRCARTARSGRSGPSCRPARRTGAGRARGPSGR